MRVVTPSFEEDWGDIEPEDIGDVYQDLMRTHYKWLWWQLDPRFSWRDFQWNYISHIYERWRPVLGEDKRGNIIYAEPGSLKVNPPYDTIASQGLFNRLRQKIQRDAPPNFKKKMLLSFDRAVSFIDIPE